MIGMMAINTFFKKRMDFVRKESEVALTQIDALKKSPPFGV